MRVFNFIPFTPLNVSESDPTWALKSTRSIRDSEYGILLWLHSRSSRKDFNPDFQFVAYTYTNLRFPLSILIFRILILILTGIQLMIFSACQVDVSTHTPAIGLKLFNFTCLWQMMYAQSYKLLFYNICGKII